MAAVTGEGPTLFLRKATGLVKGWSKFDAFLYSFMSVNFVTLGLFFALAVLGYVPTGQVLPALLVSGVFVTFLVITYAGLISVMPRAGGDYVWQSRVLGGGLAFVLAVTGWWFILWYWTPVYATILNVEVLQPLAAVFKWNGMLTWLGTKTGLFVVCVVTALLAGFLVSLGMEGYAKVQKYCFYLGMGALAFIMLVMLFGSRGGFQSSFDAESTRLFGAAPGAYQATIDLAGGASALPAKIGFSPFLGDSLLLIPFLCFWILWPNWGATLYGEVRGASDFKRVMSGMMYGLWVTIAVAVVFLLLASKFFGWDFFNAGNVNFINYFYGYTTDPGPAKVWTYPPLMVGFFFKNSLVSAIIVLLFGAWFLGWAGTLFLSSTRVIFAAAFDRILPEKVADVSEKRHVPVWALALMLIPSLIVSAFYAYWLTFRTFILDATLVIAVTFFGTAIAATVLPWRKKHLYENSAIAKYKVAGIPLISISGFLTALFLGFNLYKWLWPPFNSDSSNLYAINVPKSLYFMGGMYLLALVIYVVAKIYRKSQGIDLKAIYTEIPVE
jgi:APA family basic amino acid/polyamine antiporter